MKEERMVYFVRLHLRQSLLPYWQAGKYRGDTLGIFGLNKKERKRNNKFAEPSDYCEIAGGRGISLSVGPTLTVLKQGERKSCLYNLNPKL